MRIADRVVNRGLATYFAALSALALAPGCAPEAVTPRGPLDAPTFVSLNPCLDAILVEVAAPEQILAISHYSHQPGGSRMDRAVADRFASNGGTAEEIIALEPDIVLASVFLPPPTKAALERAGLRIESFGSPQSVAESATQIERIAALVGHPQPGEQVSAALHTPAVIVPPLDPVSGPAPSVLLWQAGQIVAGKETLIAELIREAGFVSHAEALGLDQADRVTLEQVLSDPPDLLLVAGESAGQRHPALGGLEETRVHSFDPSLFYCGGPSVADARTELARLRRSFRDTTP